MATVIENVGAVKHIEFDLPRGKGGVRIFRGRNGAGKTTALKCLAGLFGGSVDLEPSDGESKGVVQGFGRKLNVGKKLTATGEAEVPTLGGRFDIGNLIDPPVKDQKARIKARIRELVSIGGKPVRAKDLLGEQYADCISYIDVDAANEKEDPVSIADAIKRQLDREALEQEKQADIKAGLAKAKRIEAGDIDELESSNDSQVLSENYRLAVEAVSEHQKAMQAWDEAEENNKRIESQLEAALKDTGETTVAQLDADIEVQVSLVEGLRNRLIAAENSLRAMQAKRETVAAHEKHIADLRANVKVLGERPSADTLAKLMESESKARVAMLSIADIEKRKAVFESSKELQRESTEIATLATRLRDAAKFVAAEVQKAIPVGAISIFEGDLVVEHGGRGKKVPYEDLSEGERCRIALDYAVQAVGSGGVIPVRQEIWQSLDEKNRSMVSEICSDRKVWVFSAEVGEGNYTSRNMSAREAQG